MKTLTTIKRMLGILGLAGAIAFGGATFASAQGISDDDARRIALERVPGTVVHLQREMDDGILEIEVYVRARDGRLWEVTLDARDGRVIEIELED